MPNGSERVSEVLQLLAQQPAGLSAVEVADALEMSRAAGYRLLNLMQESCLIAREPGAEKGEVVVFAPGDCHRANNEGNQKRGNNECILDYCLRGLARSASALLRPVHGYAICSFAVGPRHTFADGSAYRT